MSNNPLVSCIIIFFNAEEFFEEAIESVFSQSYGNWELLLADDGSTDSSTAYAAKYAQQYPDKVRYVEHESHQNRGMSTTRNLGIRNAKGKYIAFLDSDDVWLPHKLEQQVAILEVNPEVGMVCGPSLWWHSWTGKPEDSESDYIEKFCVSPNEIISPPVFLYKAPILPPSNVLLRREAIETIGGFEEGFRGLYEDQAFYAKIYLKIPVFVSDKCWVNYRQHPNSCCSIALKTGYEYHGRLFFLNWLEKYLTQQKLRRTQIWQELQTEFLPYRHPIFFKLKGFFERFLRQIKAFLKLIVQQTFPTSLRRWLKAQLLSTTT